MDAPNPKVSIITCFYNTERFLADAVESVLAQTYANWELLLIDDGSTDRSTEIAKAFASNHGGKIIYLHHPGHVNKGSSASRNLGIEQSSGSLIAFLDADDLYYPAFLENQVQLLLRQNASMVCEATYYWYSWNGGPYKDIIVPVGAAQDKLYHPPQLLQTLYPVGKGAAPCICGMLIKKAAWMKHGGFEASFTGMYDEQIPLSKFYLHEPVYISSTCNNKYRQRPDSLVGSSQKDRKSYLQVRKLYLEWLEAYLQQHQITDPQVHQLLNKAFLPYRRPLIYFFTGTLPQGISFVKRKGTSFLKRILPTGIRQMLSGLLFNGK